MSGGQRPGEGNLNMILHSFCCSVEFSNSALLGTEGQRNNLSVEMLLNFFHLSTGDRPGPDLIFTDCSSTAAKNLRIYDKFTQHQHIYRQILLL